jgi:hypothetical protein
VLDEMNISFSKPPECILRDNPNEDGSSSYPSGQWLPGASINPAQNCLNLNGTRSLNDTVIIWRDELQDDLPLQRMTLEELRQEVWYATNSLSVCHLIFFILTNSCCYKLCNVYLHIIVIHDIYKIIFFNFFIILSLLKLGMHNLTQPILFPWWT